MSLGQRSKGEDDQAPSDSYPVVDREDSFHFTSHSKGSIWCELDRLQREKHCYHCTARKWQHSLLPVCLSCQPKIQKLICDFCKEELLQYRPLIEAERRFKHILCLSCTRNLAKYGSPKKCSLCFNFSAFDLNANCDRCSQMVEMYGPPTSSCERCGNRAAFKREPDKMQKVENRMLCFNCTTVFKKEKYKSQKKRASRGEDCSEGSRGERSHHHHHRDSHYRESSPKRRWVDSARREESSPADRSSSESTHRSRTVHHRSLTPTSSPISNHLRHRQESRGNEEHKSIIESMNLQIRSLQQQLKQKDVEVMSFAQKIEQDNFLLRKEIEENQRRISRDEVRIAQLVKELGDVERSRDREISRLIESNHEEREKLNDVIEKLKSSRDEMQKEVEKSRTTTRDAKTLAKDSATLFSQYKRHTEKRVQRLGDKFKRTVQKMEEKVKEKTKAVSDLKREIALLEKERSNAVKQEAMTLLGFEELGKEEDDEDKPLIDNAFDATTAPNSPIEERQSEHPTKTSGDLTGSETEDEQYE